MEESLQITLLPLPLPYLLHFSLILVVNFVPPLAGGFEADHVTSTVFKTCRSQGAYHRGYSAGFAGSGGGAGGLAVWGVGFGGIRP